MPVLPNLDPNILAFSTICERLSQIEETTELLRQHLRREEMCKPHGSLNSALLGFPSCLQIYLNSELQTPPPSKLDCMKMQRPFLEGSIINLQCKGKCNANSCESFYFPLYRRYFPDKAEAIIKFEEETTDAATCAQFDIKGFKMLLCDEVEYRVTRDALDRTKFSSLCDLDDDLSCGSLLITNVGERVDLCEQIGRASCRERV